MSIKVVFSEFYRKCTFLTNPEFLVCSTGRPSKWVKVKDPVGEYQALNEPSADHLYGPLEALKNLGLIESQQNVALLTIACPSGRVPSSFQDISIPNAE